MNEGRKPYQVMCSTCADLALMKTLAKNNDDQVPGLDRAVNAFTIWHLSVAHRIAFHDLAELEPVESLDA